MANSVSSKTTHHSTNKCVNLAKRLQNKSEITWSFIVKNVLDSKTSNLPSNILLIGKLDFETENVRNRFNILRSEDDFNVQIKLAKMLQCGFHVIIQYVSKDDRGSTDSHNKYIDNLIKSDSTYLSLTVTSGNSQNKNFENDIHKSLNLQTKKPFVNEIDQFINAFETTLTNMKTYLNTNNQMDLNKSECYKCDRCSAIITGTRYHCVVCLNFNLCDSCEVFSEDFHDREHSFLKIKPTASPSKGNSDVEQQEEAGSRIEPEKVIESIYDNLPNESTLNEKKTLIQHNLVKTVSAGCKITKIWRVINNGKDGWNSSVSLKYVSGNISPLDNKYSLPVPQLQSGQSGLVSASFRIPADIEASKFFFSIWALSYEDKLFGKPLFSEIIAVPNLKKDPAMVNCSIESDPKDVESKTEDSLSLDNITFPSCFDLSVPFKQPISNEQKKYKPSVEKVSLNKQKQSYSNIKENKPKKQTPNEKKPSESKRKMEKHFNEKLNNLHSKIQTKKAHKHVKQAENNSGIIPITSNLPASIVNLIMARNDTIMNILKRTIPTKCSTNISSQN